MLPTLQISTVINVREQGGADLPLENKCVCHGIIQQPQVGDIVVIDPFLHD